MSCGKSPPAEQAEADSSGVEEWQESSSLSRCGVSASASLSPGNRLQEEEGRHGERAARALSLSNCAV